MMKVVKTSDIEAQDRTSQKIFTGGKVTKQGIIGESNDELRVAIMSFSPGAHCVFHTHTFTQILYATKGEGVIATEDEEIKMEPGTWAIIPAGERHWHGSRDKAFSHVAIMPPGREILG